MAIGYMALEDQTPLRKLYAYMDTADTYRADQYFRKYKVKVNCTRKWSAPDRRYRIVFCSVSKRQMPQFEKAMAALSKRIQHLGYDDYEECWRKTVQSA